MKYPIKNSEITSQTEFYPEVIEMYKTAEAYLISFNWCDSIIQGDVYLNLGSTLSIFLFEINNKVSLNDNYLWVIVGDIPSMYLDTHGPKTTKQVLEDYIRLANDWIEHVNAGKSVANCYPFKAQPTLEMAELLSKRTLFMENTLMNSIEDVHFSNSDKF